MIPINVRITNYLLTEAVSRCKHLRGLSTISCRRPCLVILYCILQQRGPWLFVINKIGVGRSLIYRLRIAAETAAVIAAVVRHHKGVMILELLLLLWRLLLFLQVLHSCLNSDLIKTKALNGGKHAAAEHEIADLVVDADLSALVERLGMRVFPMHGKLASLPECFSAAINSAYKGLLTSVRILVLLQILWQHERLRTELALKGLLIRMHHIMTLQREFG